MIFPLSGALKKGTVIKGTLVKLGSDSENAERCLIVSFIAVYLNTIVSTGAALIMSHDSCLFLSLTHSHRIITTVGGSSHGGLTNSAKLKQKK